MSLITGHPDFDSFGRREFYLSRAKDRVKQSFLHTLWEDFYDDPTAYGNSTRWNPSAGLVSTGSVIAGDEAGGSIIYSSGATASSVSGAAPANAIGGTPWTVATSTAGKAFYVGAKLKITTTPDAQSKLLLGFTDGTNTLGVGVIGSLSTTQFVIQHSASLATTKTDLGLTVDTSYHRFEMWSNGRDGNVYAAADYDTYGVAVSVTPTVTYSKLRLLITARNGTTAADQRMQMSDLLVAVEP